MSTAFPPASQSGSPQVCAAEPLNASQRSSAPAISASEEATQHVRAPAARLCHLVRSPDYDGYGFKLLTVEQLYLPRVTAVESGSPAEAAGLRVNDTVIEVNDASLEGLKNQEVVQLIKSMPNEARLLVVDDETAAWYERQDIAIRSNLLKIVHVNSKAPESKTRKKQDTTPSLSSLSSGSTTPSELAGGLRLCHLRKWPNYEGYGFSVREDKERQSYFITGVMSNSPAELGGLRNDDRLVEVNAVSVENKSYQEIMGRMGKEPDQVDLLVIDRETDEAFASRSQRPSGQADGVLRRWTPGRPPRLTSRKSKKPVNKASPKHIATSTANVAERDGPAVSERHQVVTEDGNLIEYKQQLPAPRPVLVNCDSPLSTPRSGTDSIDLASVSIGSSEAMSPVEPTEGLRLCHLCKWPNFDGYGFALNANRNREGQFVAHVDFGSPAHLGGLRKRDRIVEGATYREVVNRIKMDPGKVDLLVIDRETDEEFARQSKTPSSQADCVVERRTPPTQPQSYARAPGFRLSFCEALGTATTPDAPTVIPGNMPRDGCTAAGKPPSNQQSKPTSSVKHVPQPSALVGTRPMTPSSETLRCNDDEAASLRNKDNGRTQWAVESQPAKSEPRYTAWPPPKLYTIEESPRRSTPATSAFMASQLRVSSGPYDNGSPSCCSVRNAADYFMAFDESSGPTSTEFSPVRSATPSNHDSPHYSPMPATPAASGQTSYASTQPCGPYCPAQSWLSMSYQAPYVPLESVPRQERWTTYAPGYSDYLTMYSGYASDAPLNSARETTPGLRQTPAECCGAENLHASLYDLAISPSSSRSRVVPPEPKHSTRSSTNASNEDEGIEA
ncbi:Na(+)/H(+) exchange regulatory cofactor NHE-RF3-like isoform X2 [Dermacentor albipictus]|uniref:Na(+)/H(+) exchange regulatory cofactor NHE-RF3-like isoform X2 n=1 Tax=Dermacentor albipictus TaxID=60249 RepID=UPI0031FE4130